jgi:predicted metal-binding membrane protein
LATEWRRGSLGAFKMGLKHGGYCLGCCWALMGLLFAFGVMNLLWVAGISAFVLLEKIVPAGPLVSRLSGFLFIAWAAWIVFGS